MNKQMPFYILSVFIFLAVAVAIWQRHYRNTADEQTSSTTSSSSKPASAPVVPAGWLTDFAAAQQKAASEGKDLLVLFTGSDWCGWCKRLDKEVFSKPGVIDQISQEFVPVFIDFPSNTARQSAALRQQNDALMSKYRVAGFPTILLMKPDGTAYAETGYREGGPAAYLEHLKELKSSKK